MSAPDPASLMWALAAAALGWLAGWCSARGARHLLEQDAEPAPVRPSRWAEDPLVQAGVAVAWGALGLRHGLSTEWAAAALLAVPLVQVAVTDLRTHYVYTVVALTGVGVGLVLSPALHGGTWWVGLSGAVLGYAVLALFYWAGRLAYRGREPLARGDMTIAAMVGAASGVWLAPAALFSGVLFSGLFAIGFLVARRSRHTFMAYGPGLCLGGLLALFW